MSGIEGEILLEYLVYSHRYVGTRAAAGCLCVTLVELCALVSGGAGTQPTRRR